MIDALVLAARLVLAAVFAVAGVTKLGDRRGTRQAVVEFGAPARSSGAIAVLLPLAELVVAALLVPSGTVGIGTIGALALLVVFSVAVGVSLARGRAPECHCFGQLHSAPASWKTLARNGLLGAVAAGGLAGSLSRRSTSAFAWIGRLDATERVALGAGLAIACLLVGGSVAFVSLLRSYGKVLVRLDSVERVLVAHGLGLDDVEPELGLAPGTPVPAVPGLPELLQRGLPVLLLFVSPQCRLCSALLERAATWQVEHAEALTVAFAVDGTPADVHAEAARYELEHVLVDEGLRAYRAFEANGTPSAVLVAPDGTVASWVAGGSGPIERLVERAVAPILLEPRLAVGAEVPALSLPSLDGEPVSLEELAGRDTLLVFWDPGCGFCREMHGDLRAWERTANGGGPRLVVVSAGDAEAMRAEGFRSLVLLDHGSTVSALFGAVGTPMGVLIGADRCVASPLAIGADAILALANGSRRAATASGRQPRPR